MLVDPAMFTTEGTSALIEDARRLTRIVAPSVPESKHNGRVLVIHGPVPIDGVGELSASAFPRAYSVVWNADHCSLPPREGATVAGLNNEGVSFVIWVLFSRAEVSGLMQKLFDLPFDPSGDAPPN